MPLHEGMERGTVTGRRAGYEVRIRRRTEAAVHCQEYDVRAATKVDRTLYWRDVSNPDGPA